MGERKHGVELVDDITARIDAALSGYETQHAGDQWYGQPIYDDDEDDIELLRPPAPLMIVGEEGPELVDQSNGWSVSTTTDSGWAQPTASNGGSDLVLAIAAGMDELPAAAESINEAAREAADVFRQFGARMTELAHLVVDVDKGG